MPRRGPPMQPVPTGRQLLTALTLEACAQLKANNARAFDALAEILRTTSQQLGFSRSRAENQKTDTAPEQKLNIAVDPDLLEEVRQKCKKAGLTLSF